MLELITLALINGAISPDDLVCYQTGSRYEVAAYNTYGEIRLRRNLTCYYQPTTNETLYDLTHQRWTLRDTRPPSSIERIRAASD